MSVFRIAFNNFKNNIKVYNMYFIAMVFSVVILCNFEMMAYGETIKRLGEYNYQYVSVLLKTVAVILMTFLIFFIWYASNIFIRNRKKEIGIYAFIGLDSNIIGKMYFIENMLIGISSCVIGIIIGIVTSKFFQVTVLKIAGYKLDVTFEVSLKGVAYTAAVFLSIFLLITIKGFFNIAGSKIIDLLNESKKSENIDKVNAFTYIIAIASIIILLTGYYISTASRSNIAYAFGATILVVIGTYGFFGSILSIVFNLLMGNKKILYKGENIITLSNLSFRLRKNYRTFATIAVVIATTITVLGTSVSMKKIYDNSVKNAGIFNIAVISYKPISEDDINFTIEQDNISGSIGVKIIGVEDELSSYDNNINSIIKYSDFKKLLKINGEEEVLKEIEKQSLNNKRCISVKKPGTLISFVGDSNKYKLNGEIYNVSKRISARVLGMAFDTALVVISDDNYLELENSAESIYFYGIKLKDNNSTESIAEKLMSNLSSSDTFIYNSNTQIERFTWLKFVYAVGAFLFLVFIMAAASILYMKMYSDAIEDKDKYRILKDIGASPKDIINSIRKEISLVYLIPLVLAAAHSYFAINVLANYLETDLIAVYIISLATCFIVFAVLCISTISAFRKIIKI